MRCSSVLHRLAHGSSSLPVSGRHLAAPVIGSSLFGNHTHPCPVYTDGHCGITEVVTRQVSRDPEGVALKGSPSTGVTRNRRPPHADRSAQSVRMEFRLGYSALPETVGTQAKGDREREYRRSVVGSEKPIKSGPG